MNDRNKEASAPWLAHERFPLSSKYETDWVLANEMGPNALWLLESLCPHMVLEPGLRVLDMGCGRAMTSIFLARERGLRVWANDLWIKPDDNWQQVKEAGLEDAICPIHAEAHQLPYAAEFFDAVVSIDSYHYYGTDDMYLSYILKVLRPGGQIGIVVPGLMQEIEGEVPRHFTEKQESGAVFWDPAECWSIHTLGWWHRHFQRSGLVDIEVAETLEDGWRVWLEWERVRNGGGFSGFPSDAEVLEKDGGRYLGFVIMVARKR